MLALSINRVFTDFSFWRDCMSSLSNPLMSYCLLRLEDLFPWLPCLSNGLGLIFVGTSWVEILYTWSLGSNGPHGFWSVFAIYSSVWRPIFTKICTFIMCLVTYHDISLEVNWFNNCVNFCIFSFFQLRLLLYLSLFSIFRKKVPS